MRKFLLGFGLVTSLATLLALRMALPDSSEREAKATATSNSDTATVARQYGQLPLAFEPNLGQTDAQAKFLAHADGYTLFLTSNEAVLALAADSSQSSRANKRAVLRLKLAGANAEPAFAGLYELPGRSNYLIGPAANWHTNVPTYRRVAEKSVYPGIDLIYYGTQRQLEYDFVVAPSADPRRIRLAIEGAQKLSTNAQGEVIVSVASGEVRLRKPVAYQGSGDGKQAVAVKYLLEGRRGVAFELGNYDSKRTLVIDPILAYSTYLGGSNIDGANAVAVALDGTAFVAGGTFSTDFPTAHALQPNAGGPNDFPSDAFVAKLSADGSTLLYSTYLGGKNQDVANGIAVDTFGNAYVTGTTLSPDFPASPGSFNALCGGDGQCGASWNPGHLIVSNGFVAKLNAEGSALIYSGFIGFYENVRAQAIAVDANQVAYITGQTGPNLTPTVPITPPNVPPPPFPITAGALQTAFGGGATDAFIMKLSATGTSITYSSYLGGNGEDVGYGVAVDGSANAYITGLSYSPDLPVTASAFQGTYGGAGDAFLAKINTNGSGAASLVYSTYFGGTGLDQGNGIAVDSSGNAFIAGGTNSAALPTTGRAYAGEGDAFVAKFNPALSGISSLIYFTYLGGTLADTAQGVAIDSGGNAYVTGSTVSTDFPVTAAVFQTLYGGGNSDAFVTKLDPSGAILLYSSFLGGSNAEGGNGIAVDTNGNAIVAGQTCSLDLPLSNPIQAAPGGNCDAFISKVSILNGIALNPAGLVFPAQSLGTTSQSETVTLTNGDSPLTITSIAVTGAFAGDFAETNTCGAALSPGQQCTITVSFTPLGSGIRRASITITDSAPGSPQVLNLTGSTSTLTLSASSLSFGNQPMGIVTAAQSVVATNSGTTALTFSTITASGDFSETDDCTKAPLQPGTNCVMNVTFTPSAAGSSVGALTLTDNAPGSPQVVLLTGTGFAQPPDFSMTPVQTSATISAGQSATFTILIAPVAGFAQPVSLACSGLPAAASCSTPVNPVTVSGTATTSVSVTVSTGQRTMAPPNWKTRTRPPSTLPSLVPTWLVVLMALLALTMTTTRGLRARRATAGLALVAGLILFSAACGSGNPTGVPAGTPAGTYQVGIVGTSGAVTHTATVSLQVK